MLRKETRNIYQNTCRYGPFFVCLTVSHSIAGCSTDVCRSFEMFEVYLGLDGDGDFRPSDFGATESHRTSLDDLLRLHDTEL